MAEAMATVFVVDDDISMREALIGLIEAAGWRVQSFGSAGAFLNHEPAGGPSCLILDMSLPDLNGLELQERLAGERTDMPIIFITGYGDVPMTVRAMKGGAIEFLTKPCCDDQLLEAVSQAIQRSRATINERAVLDDLRSRYEMLSHREREVMALVASGLLNKQVGGELGISEITVKAHRGRVMEKMQARSLADLVRMSGRLGL